VPPTRGEDSTRSNGDEDRFQQQRVASELVRRNMTAGPRLVLDGLCRVSDSLDKVCATLQDQNCIVQSLS